jgi:protein involved in polysaccharide export with SLBB domain
MNKIIAIFTIFCFIFSFSPCLYAEMGKVVSISSIKQETEPEKTVISADEYTLMPGDSVLITITGSTNYSYITGVTLEGKVTINLPVSTMKGPTAITTTPTEMIPNYDIVEAVPMYSLSINAAKDSLYRVFLKYFRRINVDITLIGMRTFMVLVAGEVNRPGIAFARPIDRVSTVLDTIGGIGAIGSHSRIKLIRGGRLVQLVDLEEFSKTGNPKANPFVQDGDLIYIPRMEQSVTVIGAIYGRREYGMVTLGLITQKTEMTVLPGEKTTESIYELIEGETVLDIITKAGITPWADLKNAFIDRNGAKLMIDLTNVLADENSTYNIQMENGDILYVPAINAVVYVGGQVFTPGSFVFQPNLKASDYIGFAGGPLAEASMSGAYIQRGNKRISIKGDPLVEQGDKIMVPRQVFKFWQDYLEIGSVVASLLISYLTYRAVTAE